MKLLSDEAVELPALAVVAQRGAKDCVCHVGVLRGAQRLIRNQSAQVYQQRPPLKLESASDEERRMDGCAAAGWMDLSDSEAESGKAWIRHLDGQMTSGQNGIRKSYCVSPPIDVVRDPITGQEIHRRYSCVGFVLDLYETGIGRAIPLNWRSAALPPVPAEMVREVWPIIDKWTTGPSMSDRLKQMADRGFALGIEGEGPWRIVLPGYALRALDGVDGSALVPTATQDGCLGRVAGRDSSAQA